VRPKTNPRVPDAPSSALFLLLTKRKEATWIRVLRSPPRGQVTIPKTVRDALELHEGDELLFRVERSRAVIAKTPKFLDLAGSVPVPPGKRGTPWNDVLRRTRADRAGRRH
jgi:antitoxin PrlF